jgi:hypothetical protein
MRLKIRAMMLAVAVFAITLHVGSTSYRRLVECRRQARFHASAENAAIFRARNIDSGAAKLHGYTADEKQRAADHARRFAAYSSRMKSKYERAVYLPFLPVEPDPTPP